jgi:hypothetical protein
MALGPCVLRCCCSVFWQPADWHWDFHLKQGFISPHEHRPSAAKARGFDISSAAAALDKKSSCNLQLLNQRSIFRQLIFSLCSSITSVGVEQLEFQSSVSRHGVEL